MANHDPKDTSKGTAPEVVTPTKSAESQFTRQQLGNEHGNTGLLRENGTELALDSPAIAPYLEAIRLMESVKEIYAGLQDMGNCHSREAAAFAKELIPNSGSIDHILASLKYLAPRDLDGAVKLAVARIGDPTLCELDAQSRLVKAISYYSPDREVGLMEVLRQGSGREPVLNAAYYELAGLIKGRGLPQPS